MTLDRSVSAADAVRIAAATLMLLVLGVLARVAIAAPASAPQRPALSVSLEQSATAVPLDGVMGFTGVIRFNDSASSVQARLQVHRPGNKLVYQRTQYLSRPVTGVGSFSFSRPLAGLGLGVGEYPATFSIRATVNGSDVATEVTTQLRIYDPQKPPVTLVLVAKVHTRPMSSPDGGFEVDPALATRSRDEIDRISNLVIDDPLARVTLALAPESLEEWRRIASNGYTLRGQAAVPAAAPEPQAYAVALAHLQDALSTGRMELVSLGYSDPHLPDLDLNKLDADAAVQYDAGISACFASIETTPSAGTVPAGGCVPQPMQRALSRRGVSYVVSDSEITRIARRSASSGAYPVAGGRLNALVVDAAASRGLESGDASATLAHAFDRLGGPSTAQPLIVRIDLDDGGADATSTVGAALRALESAPWTRLALGADTHPPKGAKTVDFTPAATKGPPAGFWPQVQAARANASGLIAVFTASDGQAAAAQTDSLLAESSSWAGRSATWELAPNGLAFARTAWQSAQSIFSDIKVSAESVTLAGSSGDVPVSIQNGTKKTLNALLVCKTAGGLTVVGTHRIPTRLAPRETFVQVPVDLGSALYGKLTVQVMAGDVVIANRTVDVRRSYLDRLVLIGGIVVVMGGLLGWIILRVRTSSEVDTKADSQHGPDDDQGAPNTPDAERDSGRGYDR